jgi:nitrate reductase NapE
MRARRVVIRILRGERPMDEARSHTRQEELRSFLALAVFMAPALAVVITAGWGFVVWIFQMFAGPPGPHA